MMIPSVERRRYIFGSVDSVGMYDCGFIALHLNAIFTSPPALNPSMSGYDVMKKKSGIAPMSVMLSAFFCIVVFSLSIAYTMYMYTGMSSVCTEKWRRCIADICIAMNDKSISFSCCDACQSIVRKSMKSANVYVEFCGHIPMNR